MGNRAILRYLTLPEGQIRVRRCGEGPDLVAIAGLTLGGEALAGRLASICPGWRITVLDLPGIGGPGGWTDLSAVAVGGTLRAALAQAGLGRFVLAAHEMASGFLPALFDAWEGEPPPCVTIGAAAARSWSRHLAAVRNVEPRSDGSHLSVLWHHLRDRQILDPQDPTQPAKVGEAPADRGELETSFVAAATNPIAYARLWEEAARMLNGGPADRRTLELAGLADLPDFLAAFADEPAGGELPPTEPLDGGRIWHDMVRTPRGVIHLRRAGAGGTPLLVLPTGGGSSAQFAPVVSGLSEGRQVFAIDYLGNGLSDKPRGEVTIETLADDAATLIETMELSEVDVWGSHTGSLVALELAVRRPDLVRRCVLEGPVFLAPPFQDDLLHRYFPHFEADPWGSHLQQIWHWRRDMFLFWPWYRAERSAARDLGLPSAEDLHLYAVGILESGSTYDLAYRSAFRYDTASRLPLLRRPALVCAGPNDMLVNGVAASAALKLPCVTTTLTPTTVWWPAPDRRASEETLAVYDRFLRG